MLPPFLRVPIALFAIVIQSSSNCHQIVIKRWYVGALTKEQAMPEPLNYAALTSLAYQREGFHDAVRTLSEKLMAGGDDDVREAQYQLLSLVKTADLGLNSDSAGDYVKFITTSLVQAEEHQKKKVPGNEGGTGFRGKNANELWAYLMLTQESFRGAVIVYQINYRHIHSQANAWMKSSARSAVKDELVRLGVGPKVADNLVKAETGRLQRQYPARPRQEAAMAGGNESGNRWGAGREGAGGNEFGERWGRR